MRHGNTTKIAVAIAASLSPMSKAMRFKFINGNLHVLIVFVLVPEVCNGEPVDTSRYRIFIRVCIGKSFRHFPILN